MSTTTNLLTNNSWCYYKNYALGNYMCHENMDNLVSQIRLESNATLTAGTYTSVTNWTVIEGNNFAKYVVYTDTSQGFVYIVFSPHCTDDNEVIQYNENSLTCVEAPSPIGIPSMTIEEANEILGASLVILATVWGIVMLKKLILPKKFT